MSGHLAAFMVTALVEDHFSILHQSSDTDYLKSPYYPNNVLVFTVTRRKLSSPQVTCVSYGLRSLDETASLDHFKFRMGFEVRPFRDRIVFNPMFRPFLVLGGGRIIDSMARRHPESDLWRKASRVLRTAEETSIRNKAENAH